MNTIEYSVTPWRRFVQVGLILVLGCIATSGIIALHVLQAESAKAPMIVLLWGILFLQMMAFLNTKCKAA
jgi:hypothetical protein